MVYIIYKGIIISDTVTLLWEVRDVIESTHLFR